MILQCPQCNARYLVPDQSIGAAGRNVRCAKCAHNWFQAPTAEATKSLGELDKMLKDFNARSEGKPKPIPPGSNLPAMRREWLPPGMIVGMAALFALVIGITILLVSPSVAGLPSSKGIVLADLGITRLVTDTRPTYEINGKILNTTDHKVAVPTLRVTLVDADGNSLQYWDFNSQGKTLEANKNIPFTTGNLEIIFSRASRFVVEIGSPLELALRRKPQ